MSSTQVTWPPTEEKDALHIPLTHQSLGGPSLVDCALQQWGSRGSPRLGGPLSLRGQIQPSRGPHPAPGPEVPHPCCGGSTGVIDPPPPKLPRSCIRQLVVQNSKAFPSLGFQLRSCSFALCLCLLQRQAHPAGLRAGQAAVLARCLPRPGWGLQLQPLAVDTSERTCRSPERGGSQLHPPQLLSPATGHWGGFLEVGGIPPPPSRDPHVRARRAGPVVN